MWHGNRIVGFKGDALIWMGTLEIAVHIIGIEFTALRPPPTGAASAAQQIQPISSPG